MSLQCGEIRLLPLTVQHADLFHSWRKEEIACRYNPFVDLTVEELTRRIAEGGSDLAAIDQYQTFRWMIDVAGKAVGWTTLKEINLMSMTAEIGYGVAEAFQGRGYATGALRILISRVFVESPLRRLVATVHAQNIASCRVLEKLGWLREGLLREHFIVSGTPADAHLFALLRRDWLKVAKSQVHYEALPGASE